MTSGPPPDAQYPQQSWGNPDGWPGGVGPGGGARGVGPAVASLVVGVLGCSLWLVPIDLTGVRGYVPLPFGVAGLIFGIVGLSGLRRGKPVAVVGVFLAVLALVLGVIMIVNQART